MSGRVQGVFFRQSAKTEADLLGVAGWARNLADGRVEIVVERDAGKVKRFLDWLRRGPALSRVDGMDVAEEPEQGIRGFEVQRGA
ncbi:MAG: acylphosphatase [Euryarchaeota archaeon]|nr:acylphosphatase [Euryarchaeota archaeon]